MDSNASNASDSLDGLVAAWPGVVILVMDHDADERVGGYRTRDGFDALNGRVTVCHDLRGLRYPGWTGVRVHNPRNGLQYSLQTGGRVRLLRWTDFNILVGRITGCRSL